VLRWRGAPTGAARLGPGRRPLRRGWGDRPGRRAAPRDDVEGDLGVGDSGLPGQADGVVEEDLVRSGLDDQGRQARQVGEDGADKAESGVASRRVVRDPGLEVSRLISTSTSRLVFMAAPARVRSAYGDMTKAAAGRGSP